MRNKLYFLLALGFLTFNMTAAFAAEDPTLQRPQSRSQQSGTIDKVTGDKVTVKTDDGKTQSFTINEAQREQLKSLKQGDRVDFTLNQQNQIVGFNKQGSMGRDSGDPSRPESNPNTNPNTNPNSGMGSSPNSGASPDPNSGMGSNPNSGMGSSPNSGAGGMSGSPSR